MYEIKHEEGLDRFKESLTKLYEYDSKIAKSKQIDELTDLIADTNRKL